MKKIVALMLAVVLCFGICACGKSAEVKAVEEALDAIGDEITLESVDPIRTAQEMFDALSAEEQAEVGNIGELYNANSMLEAVLGEYCIPGTYILLPEFALADVPNKGAWIVDDRDDFTAYNFWPETASDTERGFEQYKEYIASNVDVTDVDGETFTFTREDGVVITVCAHYYSASNTLQVRVPKN